VPETLGHYTLEAEIGHGGMGIVHRAVDTRLGRRVAIKVLPAEATADPERRRRFVQEARAASALNHPHIVTIYDIGEEGQTTFIAMELLEGTTLEKLLAEGPLPVPAALDHAVQIASALESAHASGIVHRDIKPANIMITRDGRAKVLDFGLAKLAEAANVEETVTARGTRPGMVLGTAAYMAPEQAEGRPVDARADIFSFGAVLYEMLAGRRAFTGDSDISLMTAILRDHPPPVSTVRPGVPAAVQGILNRCLAKDPAGRYQAAAQLRTDLANIAATLRAPGEAPWWRGRSVITAMGLLLILAATFGGWQLVQSRRARATRDQTIPQIQELMGSNQSLRALRLARAAERYAPEDVKRLRASWVPFNAETTPAGADVQIRNYLDANGPWEQLGATPVRNYLLPFGNLRVRISKPGFLSIEISSPALGVPATTLIPEKDALPGMVPVPAGMVSRGPGRISLPAFWIGRLEVTNREFKQFVDAGGYRDQKYWKEPFQEGDRVLSFDDAMARFRDATGRSGPAGWELGSFPEGQADVPVGGISWFEAAAYAGFVGKTLPTYDQWLRAAGIENTLFDDILAASNFDGKGPVKAGERAGVAPSGALDMAGNVKEWCLNVAQGTSRRFILGGGWDEPPYRFSESDARDPWARERTFGVRLVKSPPVPPEAAAAVGELRPDPQQIVPVADSVVQAYLRFYEYDRTPLNARVDAVDDTSSEWRKESVSFDAAYGGERVPAILFLPRNARPPYQTIVFFPSALARLVTSRDYLNNRIFDFIVRSGRALLFPIYQGTYDRRGREAAGQSGFRDLQVQWAKDVFRAVDYLETRADIDKLRIGYYGLSMGSYFAPIPLSQDARFKAAVLASTGLRYTYPPEVNPNNFAPRVKIPVLIVNGRDDFSAPSGVPERLLALLGTPPGRKSLKLFPGGHVPLDLRNLVRETLDWFDRYLGPVQ
jgi:formylglycine-generating enzyme required for sulfatase activity/dienelactone hydrolase